MNNRIVVDLDKVQWAKLYYVNQYGDESAVVKKHSCHGSSHNPKEIAFGPSITMEQYAIMRGIKAVWTPVCHLQLTANHSLDYKGSKAKSIWKEWNRRIFNKK